jgi:hypothetical protein
VIHPGDWLATTWSSPMGVGFLGSVKVIDLDGVSSDGSSHQVKVTAPDGGTTVDMLLDRVDSPTSAYYYVFVNGVPPSGTYSFEVRDPEVPANVGSISDELVANALLPPSEETISPSVKNESITASFDNVYVLKGTDWEFYDDFESGLDYTKWNSWHPNASILAGQLWVALGDSVGRAHGGLTFTNPLEIRGIKADITVDAISHQDGPPVAQIRGTFFNNGVGDVSASISVKGNTVYCGLSQQYWSEHQTVKWDNLPLDDLHDGTLLESISAGTTITASIDWDGSTLTFTANGQNRNLHARRCHIQARPC